MPNVIIYPQGNGSITDPYVMMDDDTAKMALDVNDGSIALSSSTNASSSTIANTVLSSGTSVGTNSLFVGGVQMINSSGVWVGPTAGIAGAQGSQGGQGAQGATGAQGDR